MTARSLGVCAALLFTSFAAPAKAEGEWGGYFDGRTLKSGGGEAVAEAGWPGVGAGVLFGANDTTDLGLKVAALYTGVGTYEPENLKTDFGLDLRGVFRLGIVDANAVSFLIRFEPGIRFMAFDPAVVWGPELTVGLDFGIHVMPRGTVYVGIEAPLALALPSNNANAFVAYLPILGGAGFEYHATDHIGFGGRFMAGVDIDAGDFGGSPVTRFGFIGQGYFVLAWGRTK